MLVEGACGAGDVIGGKLYVFTHCGSLAPHSSVTIRRPTPGSGLPTPGLPHRYPAAGVMDGKLHLAGGLGMDGYPMAFMEIYDPVTNSWTKGTYLPTGRGRVTGTVMDGRWYVVGGEQTGSPQAVARVDVYDFRTKTWQAKTAMPTPRSGLVSGAVKGKLYVVGGKNFSGTEFGKTRCTRPTIRGCPDAACRPPVTPCRRRGGREALRLRRQKNSSALATGHAYDAGTDTWTSRAAMPQQRAAPNGAGVINGIVYVPGGHAGDGIYTKSLYAYNPATNTWSTKAAMPAAIGCGGSGVLGGKLYVYGTCGPDGSSLGGLYAYDPGTNTWGRRINAPVRKYPAMAAVNGKLYLAGGQDPSGAPSNAVNVYDPAAGTWTTLSSMGTLRHSAAATGLNGRLYVMGGYSGNGPVAWSEVYDPATGIWRQLSEALTARSSPGSGAINGKIYLVGGQADTTLATNQAYAP